MTAGRPLIPRRNTHSRRRGATTLLVCVFVFAGVLPGRRSDVVASQPNPGTVAVFPIENLSGGIIPSDEIRQSLIATLVSDGVRVLGIDVLEQFFDRHRVRYTGGIDVATADALKAETGVQGIVIASVEQFNTSLPPKFAVFVRLVSIQGAPAVIWADDIGMSGDEAPGWFDLGLVNDASTLQSRALAQLGKSLSAYVSDRKVSAPSASSKFRPQTLYRALKLEKGKTYTVAVVPFFNLTERVNAGDIFALLFVRHLSVFPQFQVLDTGVLRTQLLDARIIMDGGLSLSDADTVAALVDADFIVGGRVLRYDGSIGVGSEVRVAFSTVVIERKTRKVLWSSDSYNDARQHSGLFERGISKTAHVMATQMVRLAAASIAGR